MKLLINNGGLGRQGKTTIAYTIYKTAKEPYRYVTNDLENASIDLNKNIAPSDLIYAPNGTVIDINPKDNIIFDFGWKPDDRLLSVAKYVDVILVPISYVTKAELILSLKNINALRKVNENIIVIVNNTETIDVKTVKMALDIVLPDLDIFVINRSRYIHRLPNENKTVFEVANENKWDGAKLNQKIIPQFLQIFDRLDINY